MSKQKIAISANFTIQPIERDLKIYLTKLNLSHEIEFTPYNQIFQQLLDPSGSFHNNKAGVNVIFLRIEDLIDSRSLDISAANLDEIEVNARELVGSLRQAGAFEVPLFVFLCP